MEPTANITYAEAFWNIMRGKKSDYTAIAEGSSCADGHYAPSAFAEEFTAALTRYNLFRRLSTIIRLSSAEGSINAASSTGTAAWMLENEYFPDAANACIQLFVKSHKLAALTRLR